MPRVTATIATLLLVGASIGINMARYPVVWEMTRPPATGDAAARDRSGIVASTGAAADHGGADRVVAVRAGDRASADRAADHRPADGAMVAFQGDSAGAAESGEASASRRAGGATVDASEPGGCTAEFCPIVPVRPSAAPPGYPEPPATLPSFEATQPSASAASSLVPVFMPDEIPSALVGESGRKDAPTDRSDSRGGSAGMVRRLPPAEVSADTPAPTARLIAQPIAAAADGVPLYPTTQPPGAEQLRSGDVR